MRSCGPPLRAEIGKFRFLNELIKLVSPRYQVTDEATSEPFSFCNRSVTG